MCIRHVFSEGKPLQNQCSVHTKLKDINQDGLRDDIIEGGFRSLRFPFIPVDLHIAYGNSLPQERIPRIAPGTFSTHMIPGKDNRCP